MNLYIQDAEVAQRPYYQIMVCPGSDYPDEPNFHDKDGKPRIFNIVFRQGKAVDVEPAVGKYMLNKKLASRSPILIPS